MIAPDEPECLSVCTLEDGVCAACGRVVFGPGRGGPAAFQSPEASGQTAGNGGGRGVRLGADEEAGGGDFRVSLSS